MRVAKFCCLLSCVLACFVGCGGAGASRRGDGGAPARAQGVPPDTVITLERDECGGWCPVYKLTISADGAVVYEGKKFVKTEGVARGRVGAEALKGLVAAFEGADYFSLQDGYGPAQENCPQVATDLPTVTTSIRTGGKFKKVEHYHGCTGLDVLKDLARLEDKIDEVADTRRWVK